MREARRIGATYSSERDFLKSPLDPMESDANSTRGWLRNGNPSGDPSKSPRCNALTRSGGRCKAPAMRSKRTGGYTRCRLHGGASTGPRTPEGKERCRRANWRHGRRSAEWNMHRKTLRRFLLLGRLEFEELRRDINRLLRECDHEQLTQNTPWSARIAQPNTGRQVSTLD